MNEQWRPIPGFRTYEVSSSGAVRSETGRILKPRRRSSGLLVVHLKSPRGHFQAYPVRSLVAATFGEAHSRAREGR